MAGPVTLLRPGHVHLAWAGGPDTYDARVDALGAAVVAHYKLAEGTGATTLTDRKGAKHGSLHNTGGIDYQLDAAVQLDQAGHSLALLGGGAPGHATVVTPMQSAAFTIDVAVQLQHKAKHIASRRSERSRSRARDKRRDSCALVSRS